MKLIVTADDVGLHRGMTAGAVQAHLHGVVTACSVVANGEAIGDAVEQLARCPRMSPGAHLTLVEERPVAGPERVPSLVGEDGRFFANFKVFAARYAIGKIRIAEVELELRAQIEKLEGLGLQLMHLNGHQHLHALPRIFDVVTRLALDYGIGYVRIPTDRSSRGTSSVRSLSMKALNVFGESARKRAQPVRHVATTGIGDAGHLTAAKLVRLLENSEADVVELVCHPGLDDRAIGSMYDWGYAWDDETRALCDPAVKETLVRRNVELIRPQDIN